MNSSAQDRAGKQNYFQTSRSAGGGGVPLASRDWVKRCVRGDAGSGVLQAGGGNDSLPALRGSSQLQGQDSFVSQLGWRCENGWLEENRRGSGHPWADSRPLMQVDCAEIRGSMPSGRWIWKRQP